MRGVDNGLTTATRPGARHRWPRPDLACSRDVSVVTGCPGWRASRTSKCGAFRPSLFSTNSLLTRRTVNLHGSRGDLDELERRTGEHHDLVDRVRPRSAGMAPHLPHPLQCLPTLDGSFALVDGGLGGPGGLVGLIPDDPAFPSYSARSARWPTRSARPQRRAANSASRSTGCAAFSPARTRHA
jgi:hypothetical protein